MSDFFGISDGVIGAVNILMRAGRGVGRTKSLIENLKSGDRVVCHDPQETKRISNILRQEGIDDVTVITCTGDKLDRLREHPRPEGRLIFDHTWVERFYLDRIADAQREFEFIQNEFSGPEEKSDPTTFKQREVAKWQEFRD